MEQRILASLTPAMIQPKFSDLSSNQTPGGRDTRISQLACSVECFPHSYLIIVASQKHTTCFPL